MARPLLTTKLHTPPTRSQLVRRPRLTSRMNAGSQGKLTVVSAPAGFGKTTLLSEWVRQSERPSAWVSLDDGDNELVRFLTYLIAALQGLDEGIGVDTQAALGASQTPPVETLITILINDIAAVESEFTLILDDCHQIDAQPILDALDLLLDHLPANIHLVMSGRVDPLLHLSRLRVGGQLTEIRQDDLRFTKAEVAAFLNDLMGLDLSPEDIAALEVRTEGWIAALQLAALSLQGRHDRKEFITAFSGSHHYIIDYLVDEVLSRQPEAIQTFLCETSILERFCASLCDAVLETEASHQILHKLEKANLFLVPLDDERRWYRYHHLFADFLGQRLRESGPERIPELHRRAGAWYAQNGLTPEAIAHSLVAKDLEQAARLIDQAFNDMCIRGEYYSTMLGWLAALPEEILRARPHLGITYAWMLSITQQIDAVEPRLREVERLAAGQLPAELQLQIAVIRPELARHRNDVTRSIELSHQVLEALEENPSESNLLAHTGVVFNLGWAHLVEGNVVKARQRFSEALALSRAAHSITLTLDAVRGLAQVQIMGGQLHQAAETYRQGLQVANTFGNQNEQSVPAAAQIHLGLGDLLREWNRLDEATRHLAQGIELGQRCQILAVDLRDGHIYQARLKQAQGDIDGALEAIREAEQLAQAYQTVPGFGGPIAACRARLMLVQARSIGGDFDPGHLEAVGGWAEARGVSVNSSINSLDEESEHLIWVRLLIAQNEPDQALHLLTRLLLAAEDGGRRGHVIEIQILQALAQGALGEPQRALNHLQRALSLAEPQGYVRTFVDEGAPMAALLHKAAAGGLAPDYANKLLAAFGAEGQRGRGAEEYQIIPSPPPPSPPSPWPLEPLSKRECEVLRLLATELSGPEIAGELTVALSTVRYHTNNIYCKLFVHNRRAAIRRAEELSLL
jgi:LuxR family maltose regulon positive regulatory protein